MPLPQITAHHDFISPLNASVHRSHEPHHCMMSASLHLIMACSTALHKCARLIVHVPHLCTSPLHHIVASDDCIELCRIPAFHHSSSSLQFITTFHQCVHHRIITAFYHCTSSLHIATVSHCCIGSLHRIMFHF